MLIKTRQYLKSYLYKIDWLYALFLFVTVFRDFYILFNLLIWRLNG